MLGLRFLQTNQVMQAAFCFSDDLKSTSANLSYFSNCLKPQNLLQPAPSPVGEGWGEGILRIAAIFPNTLTAPIQVLQLAALSLALSHGREDGAAVAIKGFVRKTACAGCFLFCTGRLKTSLKAGDKRNQAQKDAGDVCQYDGVVAFFFQKAVGGP